MSIVVDEEREDLIQEILDKDPETRMPKMVSTQKRKEIRTKRYARAGELRKLDNDALRMMRDEAVN